LCSLQRFDGEFAVSTLVLTFILQIQAITGQSYGIAIAPALKIGRQIFMLIRLCASPPMRH
jgi:hypothetical protein